MPRRLVLFSTLVVAVSGCGGSSSSLPPAGTLPLVTTTAPAPAVSAPAATTARPPKRPFRIALAADSHRPTAGRPWHIALKVTDRRGGPLGGTAKVYVLLSGKVIDTIGWFAFTHGSFKHVIVWTADKKGQPLVLRVEVDTNGGAKSVDYPILVK